MGGPFTSGALRAWTFRFLPAKHVNRCPVKQRSLSHNHSNRCAEKTGGLDATGMTGSSRGPDTQLQGSLRVSPFLHCTPEDV